jgi:hypothetical protein
MRLGWRTRSLVHVFRVGALRNALVLAAAPIAYMGAIPNSRSNGAMPPLGPLHPPQLGASNIDLIHFVLTPLASRIDLPYFTPVSKDRREV